MQLSIPNGYFVDNAVIFGDPNNGAIMSKFYDVTFPDLSASDDQAHIDLENDLRLMLGTLKEDERLQVQYYTGSDFDLSIKHFEDQTALSTIPICSSVRAELASRYRGRMAHETLIRSNVRMCISSRLPSRSFDEVFKIVSRSFDQREQFFNLLLSSYGGSVHGLDNIGNYNELLRFWSPTQARNPAVTDLEFLRSIEELCRFSGLAPRPDPAHGFYMDGYYFGVLVAKTMPRGTDARTMESLLDLNVPNVRVVLNMQSLGIEQEIRHQEERYDKLFDNLGTKPGEKPSLAAITGLKRHELRHELLMSNKVVPFKAQLIVIACEKSPDKLDERMEALRVALGKTGSTPYQPALPTSTLSFFNSATPGFGPWNKYPDFWHKMDDAVNVANMIPIASTPAADLDNADWICDGDMNNLIGGKHFTGDSPHHMIAAATTGAGKSSTLQTLALQTGYQFKFIAVIDDGLSWMTTVRKLDPTCKTIIVRSNGDQTFNIFDTRGQPLTSQHLASATALCHLLVGVHADQDKDKLRKAILAKTIQEVYGVWFRKWRKNNPEAHYDLVSELNAGHKGLLELYKIESVTDEAIQNAAYATWTHDMFPTLTDLQDELHSASLQKGPHTEMYATLASLLRPWLRDGIHGVIVDGHSNVDFASSYSTELKVVHIELGELGKSESELRAVAGFLIANEIRNHIQSLPRGWHKQVVIEEMVSFLKVPDAEQICVDYWQTMRKRSCQMIAVFQNYSTLLEVSPKVAKALISNSSAMLLLRNHNTKDLETLGQYIDLPDVVKDHIKRFPKPAELSGHEAYAGFVYAQLDGERLRFTIGRNYISHEVEKITSSSGSDFDKKKAELND